MWRACSNASTGGPIRRFKKAVKVSCSIVKRPNTYPEFVIPSEARDLQLLLVSKLQIPPFARMKTASNRLRATACAGRPHIPPPPPPPLGQPPAHTSPTESRGKPGKNS